MTSKLALLFTLIREVIFHAGGDGSVLVISDKYLDLADKFRESEESLQKPVFVREETADGEMVIFQPEGDLYETEEAIIFCPYAENRDFRFYELVIIANDIF